MAAMEFASRSIPPNDPLYIQLQDGLSRARFGEFMPCLIYQTNAILEQASLLRDLIRDCQTLYNRLLEQNQTLQGIDSKTMTLERRMSTLENWRNRIPDETILLQGGNLHGVANSVPMLFQQQQSQQTPQNLSLQFLNRFVNESRLLAHSTPVDNSGPVDNNRAKLKNFRIGAGGSAGKNKSGDARQLLDPNPFAHLPDLMVDIPPTNFNLNVSLPNDIIITPVSRATMETQNQRVSHEQTTETSSGAIYTSFTGRQPFQKKKKKVSLLKPPQNEVRRDRSDSLPTTGQILNIVETAGNAVSEVMISVSHNEMVATSTVDPFADAQSATSKTNSVAKRPLTATILTKTFKPKAASTGKSKKLLDKIDWIKKQKQASKQKEKTVTNSHLVIPILTEPLLVPKAEPIEVTEIVSEPDLPPPEQEEEPAEPDIPEPDVPQSEPEPPVTLPAAETDASKRKPFLTSKRKQAKRAEKENTPQPQVNDSIYEFCDEIGSECGSEAELAAVLGGDAEQLSPVEAQGFMESLGLLRAGSIPSPLQKLLIVTDRMTVTANDSKEMNGGYRSPVICMQSPRSHKKQQLMDYVIKSPSKNSKSIVNNNDINSTASLESLEMAESNSPVVTTTNHQPHHNNSGDIVASNGSNKPKVRNKKRTRWSCGVLPSPRKSITPNKKIRLTENDSSDSGSTKSDSVDGAANDIQALRRFKIIRNNVIEVTPTKSSAADAISFPDSSPSSSMLAPQGIKLKVIMPAGNLHKAISATVPTILRPEPKEKVSPSVVAGEGLKFRIIGLHDSGGPSGAVKKQTRVQSTTPTKSDSTASCTAELLNDLVGSVIDEGATISECKTEV